MGNLDRNWLLRRHEPVASIDAVVPEIEDLLVGHLGELLAPYLEVRRCDRVVCVGNDRVVAVSGNPYFVGGSPVRTSWSRHPH